MPGTAQGVCQQALSPTHNTSCVQAHGCRQDSPQLQCCASQGTSRSLPVPAGPQLPPSPSFTAVCSPDPPSASPEADHGPDLGEDVLQLLLGGLVRDVPHCGQRHRDTAAQPRRPPHTSPSSRGPSPTTPHRKRSAGSGPRPGPAPPAPPCRPHSAAPRFRRAPRRRRWRRRRAPGRRSGEKRSPATARSPRCPHTP